MVEMNEKLLKKGMQKQPKSDVWLQKMSIPTPWRVLENSKGEGGFKGQNF